jgi:hypothetical protein
VGCTRVHLEDLSVVLLLKGHRAGEHLPHDDAFTGVVMGI